MRIKRCVSVAAALLAVCTVAYLCKNRPSVEADDAAAATRLIPSVTPTSAVAAKAVPSAFVLPTNQTATVRGTKPYILTSERRFGQNLRLAAEALGVRTVGVLSQHELLVEADADARVRLAADKRFSKTIEFLPREKVEPALFEAFKGGAESVEASIITLSAEDRPRVKARIVSAGGEILTGCVDDGDSFGARLSANLVARLAGSGDVRWMERFVRPHLMNNLAVTNVAMNVQEAWNVLGLSGDGQFVSTSDSGIDTGNLKTLHEDLRDRVVAIKVNTYCSTNDVSGHGTHTAGSIVGTGKMWTNETGVVRGTAYGAKLYAWFCGSGDGVRTPSTIGALFRNEGDEKGGPWPTFIHSASWGNTENGKYDSQCRQIDTYVWSHPDFLPVFAAGNEGFDLETREVVPQSIGSPAAAKNVLAVGATQNLRTEPPQIVRDQKGKPVMVLDNGNPKVTAEYSSRGPCQDGRIKPDIAAPGTGILSTRAHDVDYDKKGYGNYDEFYAYDTGTSMACPLTAGAVALVREWLMRDCGFTTNEPPTAALMKAIITGGAKDAARPNSDQGWGRVDLMETLSPSNRAVKLFDRIPFADGEKNFTRVLEITNAAPLDVQLVWIDYPGDASAAQSAPKLINDLDLVVTPLDGEGVFYGNGGAGPDATNTVESVRIASVEPGKYVITVKNTNVTYDHTSGGAAALYIRGAFDPEAEMEELMCVSNRMTQVEYPTLDEALAAAGDGETLEVFRPVDLHKPFTITNGVTLVAAGDAAATPVIYRGYAMLAVAVDARLSLSNVVFAGTSGEFIRVATNGVLSVAGTVEIPGAMDGLTYVTVDGTNCFTLAGPLDPNSFIAVRCDKASAKGAVFGQITCEATPDVEESAKRILNWHDGELGGSIDGTNLKWDAVPIDPRRAFAYSTEGEYFLRLSTLLAKHTSGDVIILRDCTETVAMEIKGDRQICSTNDPALRVTLNGNAAFHIGNDASLVVSNVVVLGASAEGAFVLRGGKLSLEDGAVIENCASRRAPLPGSEEVYAEGGAVSVLCDDDWALTSALLTMKPGAVIRNCSALSRGGAVFVDLDCEFDMQGGVISNCFAISSGGGVYADAFSEYLSRVDLSGDATIVDNGSTAYGDVKPDNLYLSTTNGILKLAGELTGRVQLRCEREEPQKGQHFGVVGFNDPMAASNSVLNLWCDSNPQLWHGAVAEDGVTIVWSDELAPLPPPEFVVARVIYEQEDGAITNAFETLEEAFASVRADATVEIAVSTNLTRKVEVKYDLVVRSEEEQVTVQAGNKLAFEVAGGASLTLTNIWLESGRVSVTPGGSLTMENGSLISDFDDSGSRDAVGVCVDNGTFTMKDGAEIRNCSNAWKLDPYQNPPQASTAGGVMVTGKNARFRMEGGTITNCIGVLGGGVSIESEARIEISGNASISGNTRTRWWTTPRANLSLAHEEMKSPNGELILTGEFTGDIGIREPRIGEKGIVVETNVFGRVAEDAGDLAALVPSAARFCRDIDQSVKGLIVTNSDEALLVWSTAVNEDGVYVDAAGNKYKVVAPPPEEWTVVTNHPSPIAFKSIDRVSDTEWTLVVTDRVEYCNYRLLWTTNLVEGFISTGAWEHAVGPAADPVWATNVITTGGVWFWRAEGSDGTNMVLKTEE